MVQPYDLIEQVLECFTDVYACADRLKDGEGIQPATFGLHLKDQS